MSASIVPALAAQADVFARALDARDARFDGVFFVGIITTRIYCRPVCPARVSYHDHRRFFRSAAAAESAGFRPCMRCRPELAPGLALIDAVSRLARDAVNRIAGGALNGHSVADLSRDLGVSERHLRRALEREIGASPLELAQTHRLLLAKRLLADTRLTITRIAYASGFQSLRRFNAAFRAQYRMAPSALRASPGARGGKLGELADDAPVRLSLAYRAPFAWDALLAFLRRDAVDGIDLVDGKRYGRTVELEGHTGFVFIENAGARGGRRETAPANAFTGHARRLTNVSTSHVNVEISPSLVPVLMPLLARLRQLFDLDAEPTVIDTHLGQGRLGALIAQRPGVRIPGAFDGFDVALRAILRGRARGGRGGPASSDPAACVAAALGEPIATGIAALSRLAPTAARVADAGATRLETLGVPRRRAIAAIVVARLVADGKLVLAQGSDPIATRRLLTKIDGVGDQMAAMIVMRALSWPDALPATDPALQRAAGVATASALEACGEQWRPWRTYAALHLWLEDEELN